MSPWAQAVYLVAAALFILGLKRLSQPRTAVGGNQLGALGMALAVVATVIDADLIDYRWLAVGLVAGVVIGTGLALRVPMTGMPELVALFNGFGGAASVLVATSLHLTEAETVAGPDAMAGRTVGAAAFAALIGAVTFTGSVVAFAKLRESLHWNGFPGVQAVNTILAVAGVGAGVALVVDPLGPWLWVVVAIGAVLGALAAIPIGGADMPVVIALLNSLSGLAAVGAGFVLDNPLLIIAGALVGASGLILTRIMSRAMNRSVAAVLFQPAPDSAGGGGRGGAGDEVYEGKVRSTSAEEVALILDTAERVVIVPGYGLAVAQAQHAVRDLTRTLEEKGAKVRFGIHPVAGRMPGHMNVLLAEAEIDYDHLVEMDDINPTFDRTDVTLVLGANDVVNPVARTDPASPIAGMPILDVDRSRVVVVIKRSLSPGFAGIANPLFAADNTLMLFADGRQAVVDITKALNEL